MDSWLPSAAMVWGVFPRLLGLVLGVSFASLLGQVVPIAGPDGVMPARDLLGAVRRDFPAPRRYLHFPTLLWISSSAAALRGVCLLGLAAAASIVVGGAHVPFAFLLCALLYLTLDRSVGLVFPWDCALFEAVWFATLLPSPAVLPELTASALPAPAVAFAYRLLVLRILLGFGKFKFLGSTARDWGYLSGFLISQPLVTPFGWRLHKLPLPWLKLAMVGMFVAEIPLPLAALVPGLPGVVAGLGVAGLMLGIWLSGNFGYFNLVVIALSTTLLDGDGMRGLGLASLTDPSGPLLATHLVALHTGFALVVFPLNSFSAQAWSHWPLFQRIRPAWLAGPVHLLRALQPFRLVHPFGVFPPGTMPGVKCVTVIEATHDGTEWFECGHRFSPTKETSRPRFVAPHHPRGDQAVIYETFGLNGTSILHAFIGTGLPYAYSHVSGAKLLVDRMLDGRAGGYGTVFFAAETTERLRVPPVAVRIRTVMLEPTSVAEQRATGRWWTRTTIGPHLPETRRDPALRGDVLPPPELWHWEDVLWKRRTHLERVRRAALAGATSTAAALEWPEGLAPADVDAFWSEFVPRVARVDRSSWDGLPELAKRLEVELGRDALRRHERVLGRLCFALAAKLEPLFLGEGLPPLLGLRPATIDVKSYLHLGMLLHVIALEGREAFERVWEEPRRAAEHAASLTLAGGLFLQALFRLEAFVFEAQKLRLLQAILEPERDDRPAPPPALQALAERAFGAVEAVPFLREQFRGAAFETGEPERYPRFVLPPDGRAVRAPAPTPARPS